jgi:hypothetical protein
MRPCILLLTVLVILVGCKPEDTPAALQLVRALVVDPKSIGENRHAIGEVKPRYESDVSFRVAGRVLSRRVDVGAWVMCGRRHGKHFLTLMQHWSGAVMCPACLCGRYGRWP